MKNQTQRVQRLETDADADRHEVLILTLGTNDSWCISDGRSGHGEPPAGEYAYVVRLGGIDVVRDF